MLSLPCTAYDRILLCLFLVFLTLFWPFLSFQIHPSNITDAKVIINRWTENAKAIANKGDLLLTCKGTVGKTVILQEEKVHIARQIMAITSYKADINFIRFFIERQIGALKAQAKSIIPGIERKNILLLTFPLPPLAEQKRIVAKIEELLPLVDRYEKAWTKLEEFNHRFPEDMKKSILQQAIQGKLVEQRPEEGTAQELYAQIQAEKQRLIKEGKLKKEKPLPEITEDEKPFEIPEGWMWVRLGQIFNLQAGKNITAANIYDEPSEKHKYLCYGGNGVRGYVSSFNREGNFALIGRQGALCGNINIANGQFYATEHAVVVDHYNLTDVLWGARFLKALNLNQYATATAQPGLAVSNIIKVLIPLPPLAEQKRIVEKLEELLAMCERLKRVRGN